MDDMEVLTEEQKVLDDHEIKVEDLIGRLEDLVVTTEPVRPHAATDHREAASGLMRNQKRLRYLKTSLDKAKGTIRLLQPMTGPGYLPRGENEEGSRYFNEETV